jgi:hypothetical protein
VPYGLSGRDAKAHRVVRLASLVTLLVIITVGVSLVLMFSDFKWLAPGIEKWVSFVRVLTLLTIVGGVAAGLWNAWAVLTSPRRWTAKVWSVVLAVSFLTIFWVGIVFKMAGVSGEF